MKELKFRNNICNKMKYAEILPILAVFTLICSSGANMILRKIYIIAAISIAMLFYYKKINGKAVLVYIGLCLFFIIDSVFLNTAVTDYHELLLLIIRCTCCLIIVSTLTLEQFKDAFIKIMIFLSILSLICFGLILLGVTLPGSVTINNSYCTFYHCYSFTLQDETRRYRNCGIFTEPGIYEIYLNLAMVILLSMKSIPLKKMRRYFWVLSMALISTISSMGYLAYLLVLILYISYKPEMFGMKQKNGVYWRMAICVCLLIIGVICGNIVMNFVLGTNSWSSRHDDTILTFLIAKDYPFWGIGIATDPIEIWDIYYNRYSALRLYTGYQKAMSCGLGNYMCMAGIPFTVLYLVALVKMFTRMFEKKQYLLKLIIAVLIVMFLLEEPLLPTPFFYMGIFTMAAWKMKQNFNEIYSNDIKAIGREGI